MHEDDARGCVLKHSPLGKCVLNNLFLVKETFNQTDALKRTCSAVHALLHPSALVKLVTLNGLDWFQT